MLRTAVLCLGLALGMLGVSYAAVPLYDWFCRVTGYAGTTQRAEDTTGEILDRTITVRFDANTASDLDWSFKPSQRAITLRIGEKAQTHYVATNPDNDASWGTASFNVSPGAAGQYFNKIECFCFTEQKLEAGQSVEMPVIFFVDPAIVDDPLMKNIDAITLSYTFFADEEAEADARAQEVSDAGAKAKPEGSKDDAKAL